MTARLLSALVVVVCIPLVGCGKSSPAAPTSGPAVPSPSGPCLATLVSPPVFEAKHANWAQVGSIDVVLVDGKPKSATLHDARGKAVPSEPLPIDDREVLRAWIESSSCALGGLFAYGEDPKKGASSVTIRIYKPESDNEGIDLAELCTEPASFLSNVPDADPEQREIIDSHYYDESLSSRRWRSWHFDMLKELRQSSGPSAMKSIKVKRGVELEQAAKAAGKSSCWWATVLQR